MSELIKLEGVSCDIAGKRILTLVDLALAPGEITVVLGPSGAGKTTLLRAIAGFEPIVEGRIAIGGNVLSAPNFLVPPEARRLGLVAQNYALFPHLTALGNIMFGLAGADKVRLAQDWLARVNLGERGNSYPHELSGGEQQRVALARALARDPAVVLLDEAFSSLDQQLRRTVRGEARQLLKAAGAAVLAVTHDPDEAIELADRILVLSEGRVIQYGTAEELYWRPQSRIAARLLGEVNEIEGEVRGGALQSEFGPIPALGIVDGTRATALVRPAAISLGLEAKGPATIVASYFAGGQRRLVVECDGGASASVCANCVDGPAVGTKVRLEFMPDRFTVIPG